MRLGEAGTRFRADQFQKQLSLLDSIALIHQAAGHDARLLNADLDTAGGEDPAIDHQSLHQIPGFHFQGLHFWTPQPPGCEGPCQQEQAQGGAPKDDPPQSHFSLR